MAIFREGTNPVWGAFVGVFVLGALGIDFYWLFTESGPIRWLAEVEAPIFGGWYPKLTFLIVLLAELLPVLGLKLAIEALTGRRLAPPGR
jgi:hypothetical protein